jgi:TRAP-type C4-dicarboxylate transport system permease small subunit
MKNLLKLAAGLIENFNRVMYWFGAIAIVVSSLVITYNVIMRYLLRIPTIWEIELAIYLGIMATFLGAPYGLKEGAHINIDLVIRVFSKSLQDKLNRVTSFISLGFCIFLAYNGWLYWWKAFSKGWRSESLWGPPLAIPYFFIPMGMTLLSLQFIIEILRIGKSKKISSNH